MNYQFVITKGQCAGYRKEITQPGRILIGRDATCDLTIADPILSRQHCLLEFSPQHVKVIDLKSRNGTFINGERIDEKIVDSTDEIKVGRHIFNIRSGTSRVPSSSTGLIGLCAQCGKNISQTDLQHLKAVRHGPNLYCEVCLNKGIDGNRLKRPPTQPINVNVNLRETQQEIRAVQTTKAPARAYQQMPVENSIPKTPVAEVNNIANQHDHRQTLPAGSPSKIGSYEILEMIGEGGMGFVFRAKHSFLDTIVAIKVIKEELAAQPDILKRFLQEAKLGVSLDHPNILKIHDAGESDGVFFIAMEFFEGQDMTKLVKTRGAINYSIVLKWSIQLADALEHAHKHGVIHRDVKPSNVLVNQNGLVKLADFGLAKAWQKSGANQLTASGQMLGTIQYISPEQLEDSRNVDPRTDVFSLGATIYYILTGTPPFGQEPLGKVLQNILHNNPPPVSDYIKGVPEEIENVLLKAMSKNIDQRYKSCDELKTAFIELQRKFS